MHEMIFRNASVAMICTGIDGKIKDYNEYFKILMNNDKNEIRYANINQIMNKSDYETYKEAVLDMVLGKHGSFSYECLINVDGEEDLYVDLNVSCDETKENIIIVIYDLRERKNSEQRMLKLYETLEKTVTKKSRELNKAMKNLQRELLINKSIAKISEYIIKKDESSINISMLLVEELKMLTKSENGVIFELEEDSEICHRIIEFKGDGEDNLKQKLKAGQLFFENYDEGNGFYKISGVEGNINSVLFAPVIAEGEMLGQILLTNSKEIYTESDLELVRRFAMLYAMALQRTKNSIELKRAKYKAEEANRAKSLFLSTMSHEIRTPINSVVGFTELLELMDLGKKEKKYLNAIKSSSRTLLTIIDDILDLSKIEAGKMELHHEPTDINKVFLDIRDMFSERVKNKGLDFKFKINREDRTLLLLDEIRIRQIMINLIGNAVKFTEEGYVSVFMECIRKDEESVKLRIEVEDTGIGIENEAKYRIFESFTQQDSMVAKKFGGTGLGLSITQKLVTMMGGKIDLNSEEGKGTKFIVELEDVVEYKSSKSMCIKQDYKIKLNEVENSKILIADDVKSNRMLLRETLLASKVKFDIYEAANGLEVLEIMNANKIDIIFMDIRMPKMDGIEASKIIKKEEKFKNVKIVALTASVFEDENNKIDKKYFDEFIRKPAHIKEIYSVIYELLIDKRVEKNLVELKERELYASKENLKLLKGNLYEKHKKILKDKFSDDIIDFASELLNIAQKEEIDELIKLARNIKEMLEEFDIDGVDNLIRMYPSIISKVKER